MNKEIDFAPSNKIKNRQILCTEFYKNILEEDEWPLIVTDESSIYDFTLDDDFLISKIFRYYGIKILPSDLKNPFWKLIDLVNKKSET
jgi:hypothetical protein